MTSEVISNDFSEMTSEVISSEMTSEVFGG